MFIGHLSNLANNMDVLGFALITGAASGIGRECAKGFAREGAAGIALLDRNNDALAAVKREIEDSIKSHQAGPCKIEVYQIDVSNEEQVNSTVDAVSKSFGRIDYLINAAGIASKHVGGAAFAETSDWQRVININLTGTFFVLRAVAKIMLQQDPILSSLNGRPLQRGSIVNFSSILGIVGIDLSTAYTAAKHAVTGLTRSAANDYGKDGLRINCVCPGYTETPMTTKDPIVAKVMEEKVGKDVPMGRMGKPEEIADGVLYLAGGRSSFVTGTALIIDGGYTSK